MLAEYDLQSLLANITPPFAAAEEFKPRPEILKSAVENAEKYINCNTGTLSAALYMRFSRDGCRTEYEKVYFERRKALCALVVGEYAQSGGRFVNDIVNVIWAICEESAWNIPAHNDGFPLPDTDRPIVDLFAAQTASLLALTLSVLKKSLDGVCVKIGERIKREISKRITEPVLSGDFWWMGFGENRRKVPSNWTAWCASMCLTACLLTEDNPQKRTDTAKKLCAVMDYYITQYPSDGGCDEGAEYWSMSAGCMFDFLEVLCRVTDGKTDIFDTPKLRRMGEYICRAYVGGDYFINFADCAARADAGGARTYLFGKRVGSENMMRLGFGDYISRKDKTLPDSMNLLHKLFWIENEPKPCGIYEPRREYIESLQILKVNSENITLTARGGCNGDNHNHNDAGSYMVYIDAKPVVIDVGVESYTAKTFGSGRYDIWTMQSAYHNLPTVNGVMQSPGEEYRAENTVDGENFIEFNIEGAYPPKADILSWKRRCELLDGEAVITDKFETAHPTRDIAITVMTAQKPIISDNGEIIIGNGKLVPSGWSSEIEEISTHGDEKLTPVWGDYVYRILFVPDTELKKGEFVLRIRRIEK